MAIDLVCHQFRSHNGCIGGVETLAFNPCTGTRDTKVLPMGSDKDGLEAGSKSWSGIGCDESAQPEISSKFSAFDRFRNYFKLFIIIITLLNIIDLVIGGKISFDAISIYHALIFQILEVLGGIALIFVIILREEIHSALKKF